MIFSTLTDSEYARINASICPVCESSVFDITNDSGIEGNTAWQVAICNICGTEWTARYRLSDYDLETTPDLDSGDIEIVRTLGPTNVSIVKTGDAWSVLVKSEDRTVWLTSPDNIKVKRIKDPSVKKDILQAFDDIALMRKLSHEKEG